MDTLGTMIAEPKLDNCKHCNGIPTRRTKQVSGRGYYDGYVVYYIECSDCGIRTGEYTLEKVPMRIWNSDRRTNGELESFYAL